MEPTDPPRPAAPSLLSGSPGKNDPAKDSGRILASLEKGPAIADAGRARKTPAAAKAAPAGPRLLPLLGAGIAVGALIWFLSGHVQPPGTAKPTPQAAAVPPAAVPPAAAAPATATIVSTTPSQPSEASTIQGGGAANAPVPAAPVAVNTASAAPVSRTQHEPLASIEPAGQPQRSPLAVLTDDDTDAPQKDKKAAHPHKKTDSDIRLIEALVSHVNGEALADDGLQPKKPKTARAATNTDSAD